uniref:Tudor domain-containing protein n=1 Tax=Panagrellus redivivus TaxID=6233 RepID=A0A7E4W149_PANRE
MSSQNLAVKRFTHDWLIRFVELHPIETYFDNYLLGSARYGPEQSPFDKISPYFSNLLQRYMPDIINPCNVQFKENDLFLKPNIEDDDEAEQFPFPPGNGKAVVIMKAMLFEDTNAGTLTKYIERRVFCIDSDNTACYNSSFTPGELVYLTKHTKNGLSLYKCTLTEPVSFSAIWPLIKGLDSIELIVKNLDIDEGTKQALLYMPCEVRASSFTIYSSSVKEDVIMAFVECFLNSPKFPQLFEWGMHPELRDIDFQPIGQEIKRRMKASGYVWDKHDGENMNAYISGDYGGNALIVRSADKVFHVLSFPRF